MIKTMRDVFLEKIYSHMKENDRVAFITADFGAPVLDKIREDFSGRFYNVGIAEQNLINVATGMALEGFTVFAYAISPFITMRCYEQVRVNLCISSQLKELNVNLIGVGAGVSYDVSGPSHHCLEDISIMTQLPNIEVFSPSDYVTASEFADYSVNVKKPKYLRFDSKPLPAIYRQGEVDISRGFACLAEGARVCVLTTAFMTQKFLKINEEFFNNAVGHIDLYMIKPLNRELLKETLIKYDLVIVLEEGFVQYGGMNKIIMELLADSPSTRVKVMGFKDKYNFEIGDREYIHEINGLSQRDIIDNVQNELSKFV